MVQERWAEEQWRQGVKQVIMTCWSDSKVSTHLEEITNRSNIDCVPILCHALCSVEFSRSVVSDSATPWTTACQASLSITNSRSPPKPMSIESVMPSNHLILCHPFSSCHQSFPASGSFPICLFGVCLYLWAACSMRAVLGSVFSIHLCLILSLP